MNSWSKITIGIPLNQRLLCIEEVQPNNPFTEVILTKPFYN